MKLSLVAFFLGLLLTVNADIERLKLLFVFNCLFAVGIIAKIAIIHLFMKFNFVLPNT